jgi:hypothetical protein
METIDIEIHNEIEDSIFRGLKKACYKTLIYSQFESIYIPSEYLFTVCVADEINETISQRGFKILIEFYTSDLAQMNYEEMGGDIFNLLLNNISNTKRNGKVDIALIHTIQKAFSCIELKRFNPSKSKLIDDVKRLSELVNKEGDTGPPKILIDYLAFIYGGKGHFPDKVAKEKEAFSYYTEVLEEINKDFILNNNSHPNVYFPFQYEIVTKTVSYDIFENHDPDSGEDMSHQYVGVLFKIKRPN